MFKIFDKLGGLEPTLDVLQRRRKGFRPSARAVTEWRVQRKIPPVNVAHLMAECADRGIPFDITDFRLPEKEKVKGFPRGDDSHSRRRGRGLADRKR